MTKSFLLYTVIPLGSHKHKFVCMLKNIQIENFKQCLNRLSTNSPTGKIILLPVSGWSFFNWNFMNFYRKYTKCLLAILIKCSHFYFPFIFVTKFLFYFLFIFSCFFHFSSIAFIYQILNLFIFNEFYICLIVCFLFFLILCSSSFFYFLFFYLNLFPLLCFAFFIFFIFCYTIFFILLSFQFSFFVSSIFPFFLFSFCIFRFLHCFKFLIFSMVLLFSF